VALPISLSSWISLNLLSGPGYRILFLRLLLFPLNLQKLTFSKRRTVHLSLHQTISLFYSYPSCALLSFNFTVYISAGINCYNFQYIIFFYIRNNKICRSSCNSFPLLFISTTSPNLTTSQSSGIKPISVCLKLLFIVNHFFEPFVSPFRVV